MQVKDVMTPSVVTVSREDSAETAAKIMGRHGIGAVPVVSGEEVCGILTDRDIVLRCISNGKDPKECTTEEIMTSSVVKVSPDASVDQLAKEMCRNQIRRVPVVQEGHLVGIASLCDLSRNACDRDAVQALFDISMP